MRIFAIRTCFDSALFKVCGDAFLDTNNLSERVLFLDIAQAVN